MIITTYETIPKKEITKVLGLVKGNTIRAHHLGRDLLAILRTIIGGEIIDYTKAIAEAGEQAIDRMIEDANRLGAGATVVMLFTTSYIMHGSAEILAYGTAVMLGEE